MKRESSAQLLPRYTYEDYKLWEGDWELLEGVPSAMAPSPFLSINLLYQRSSIRYGIKLTYF